MTLILDTLVPFSTWGFLPATRVALVALLLPMAGARAQAVQEQDALVDTKRPERVPREPESKLEAIETVFTGTVVGKDGAAIADAVVVTSAGGRAVTDADGSFRLHIPLSPSAESVQVTAAANSGTGTLVSSARISTPSVGGTIPTGTLTVESSGSCQPSWLPTFGGIPGVYGGVFELTVFDDGGGPALYVGGGFQTAGGVPANNIAKWDGSSWSALGSGTDNRVVVMTVFDDGSGPALYAGGYFSTAGGVAASRVAKWDGSSWSALGSGTSGSNSFVDALAGFDDGSGPALYAGGEFTTAGGVAAARIAKWNGSTWSPVGSGMDNDVRDLTVFDDGSGPALYAGGWFTTAGGVAASRVAKWDGSSWSALGSGTSGSDNSVRALGIFDDGSGSALYVAGEFDAAGGVPANNIAKWDGSSWSAVGTGTTGIYVAILDLTVFDDGSGPALYAIGNFTQVGGLPVNRIAKWNGSSWSALGSGLGSYGEAVTAFDDGSGQALYAGGYFFDAGGVAANSIAKWSGSSWSRIGSGCNRLVLALNVLDDGSGPALYAGGWFQTVGDLSALYLAKWNGSSWSALSGLNGSVQAMTVFDDGNGPSLYAGGSFTTGGVLRRIAKWNGSSWSSPGPGMGDIVADLEVFDDGNGPRLYATGDFATAGDTAASRIAKWNGLYWSVLGSGLGGAPATGSALAVFDDGSGPALYVGGIFTTAGGVPANCIARWDGSSWSAVGGGVNGPVSAMLVFDDGSEPALYAGGGFTVAGGVAANRIAKWNGTSWSALGSGLNDDVDALTAFNDGSGRALAVGGDFTTAGGLAVNHIAKWDDSTWSALGSGMNGPVHALIEFDEGAGGGGKTLLAGGDFSSALDSHDSFLARWGCATTSPGTSFCFGDASGGMIPCPCSNTGITGHGCANSVASSRGALLESFGSPSQDTVRLAASEERPSGLSIFLQGSASTATGLVYGDGIRCVNGALKRLYNKSASAGSVSAPGAGELSIRTRSAAAGDPIPAGATRYYQVYYRDPSPAFCPSPPGNTWNVTNGIQIVWP